MAEELKTSIDLTTAFITAALSAGGALIASWVGARLALSQFRHERSYEAQIEWHRALAEVAKVLSNRSRAIRSFRRMNTPSELSSPLVEGVAELAFKFQELAEQASLYAKKDTCEAILEIVKDMNGLRAKFDKPSETRGMSEEERDADHYEASLLGLGMVYEILASDLRELLGLEKLEKHRKLNKFVKGGMRRADEGG